MWLRRRNFHRSFCSFKVIYWIIKSISFICRYIARLETTLVNTCKDLGVTAKTTDETGVWVENRKIASIGRCSISLKSFDKVVLHRINWIFALRDYSDVICCGMWCSKCVLYHSPEQNAVWWIKPDKLCLELGLFHLAKHIDPGLSCTLCAYSLHMTDLSFQW